MKSEQERAEFEAWGKTMSGWSGRMDKFGDYVCESEEFSWRAWQAARAALQSQAINEGWKEAAIAWEVCASIHRQYCKGKDPFFKTRQADFVKHAEDARTRALETGALQSQDREDAVRFRKIINMTRAEREEVLFFPEDKDVIKAIDHARRVEGKK